MEASPCRIQGVPTLRAVICRWPEVSIAGGADAHCLVGEGRRPRLMIGACKGTVTMVKYVNFASMLFWRRVNVMILPSAQERMVVENSRGIPRFGRPGAADCGASGHQDDSVAWASPTTNSSERRRDGRGWYRRSNSSGSGKSQHRAHHTGRAEAIGASWH